MTADADQLIPYLIVKWGGLRCIVIGGGGGGWVALGELAKIVHELGARNQKCIVSLSRLSITVCWKIEE